MSAFRRTHSSTIRTVSPTAMVDMAKNTPRSLNTGYEIRKASSTEIPTPASMPSHGLMPAIV
ncbi:hypothetical protein D9M68_975510 [compost metagenome]